MTGATISATCRWGAEMNKVFANAYERACDPQDIIKVLLEAVKAAELHIHDEIANFGARNDFADTDLLAKLQKAIDLAEDR